MGVRGSCTRANAAASKASAAPVALGCSGGATGQSSPPSSSCSSLALSPTLIGDALLRLEESATGLLRLLHERARAAAILLWDIEGMTIGDEVAAPSLGRCTARAVGAAGRGDGDIGHRLVLWAQEEPDDVSKSEIRETTEPVQRKMTGDERHWN